MIRTLSVEGGIMGDFNFLSKFSEMIVCYFGIFKDILSSLRKPRLLDTDKSNNLQGRAFSDYLKYL